MDHETLSQHEISFNPRGGSGDVDGLGDGGLLLGLLLAHSNSALHANDAHVIETGGVAPG